MELEVSKSLRLKVTLLLLGVQVIYLNHEYYIKKHGKRLSQKSLKMNELREKNELFSQLFSFCVKKDCLSLIIIARNQSLLS